jgi:hypothetical protein
VEKQTKNCKYFLFNFFPFGLDLRLVKSAACVTRGKLRFDNRVVKRRAFGLRNIQVFAEGVVFRFGVAGEVDDRGSWALSGTLTTTSGFLGSGGLVFLVSFVLACSGRDGAAFQDGSEGGFESSGNDVEKTGVVDIASSVKVLVDVDKVEVLEERVSTDGSRFFLGEGIAFRVESLERAEVNFLEGSEATDIAVGVEGAVEGFLEFFEDGFVLFVLIGDARLMDHLGEFAECESEEGSAEEERPDVRLGVNVGVEVHTAGRLTTTGETVVVLQVGNIVRVMIEKSGGSAHMVFDLGTGVFSETRKLGVDPSFDVLGTIGFTNLVQSSEAQGVRITARDELLLTILVDVADHDAIVGGKGCFISEGSFSFHRALGTSGDTVGFNAEDVWEGVVSHIESIHCGADAVVGIGDDIGGERRGTLWLLGGHEKTRRNEEVYKRRKHFYF